MNENSGNHVKLTQYSSGAGCGCKISPKDLNEILKNQGPAENLSHTFNDLLVGHDARDDAAVYRLNENESIISTTDFFMPIVDDASDFGRIASVNAISDIYAMGGYPVMAIAILGWPLKKLSTETAGEVLKGAREVCQDAGIPLAGGHSIDTEEPIFGLAVTGRVETGQNNNRLKKNSEARKGDLVFLTKPLGIGILTTAEKQGILEYKDRHLALEQMKKLNTFGREVSDLAAVHAMTDVTGFGLLGHLLEICRGSRLSADLDITAVPVIAGARDYLKKGAIPGGTERNWQSYSSDIKGLPGEDTDPDLELRRLYCDPQTSGGLLITVDENAGDEFLERATAHGLSLKPIAVLNDGPVEIRVGGLK